MIILFISKDGSGLGLAERVKNEGHSTSMYTVDKDADSVGVGMVDRVTLPSHIIQQNGYPIQSSINQLLKQVKPDLVIFDTFNLGRVASSIRSSIPVLGSSLWSDHLSLDQSYGYRLMKQVGIPPLTHDALVLGGVEVWCELWWDGLRASVYNVSCVDKRFMNGDVGPVVGCAGAVVKMVSSESKLVREGVGKMERLLKKTTYRGPLSLSTVATKDKLYGIQFTTGFSSNNIQALFELYKGSITELLYNTSTAGKVVGEFTSDYSISIPLSLPPYPTTQVKASVGVKVGGVNSENAKHVWWSDVKKDGGYVSAGASGIPLIVTARGRDVGECRKRAYRTIHNLVIRDVQYRSDVGERFDKGEELLKRWGYV
ncbi:hypothetical protein LCGC14_0686880 [marine sediment metagenome]|uniref:Glycinamide ribonucleotide synthetase n=1 Tax=marine sediment metagenome TaxID=412755 RepID=A0A0F9TUK8_9ZZZZ